MNLTCQICKVTFGESRKLHYHLRSHQLKIDEYYHKYFERRDLHTNELIEFKNYEQYFAGDFNSKENMIAWFRQQTPEQSAKYCKDILVRRKEKKNLVWAPSQVELRSIMSPSIITMQKVFGDYYGTCAAMGLKNKYKWTEHFLSAKIDDPKDVYSVVVDSREQRPLEFPNAYQKSRRKLDFGDYRLDSHEGVNHTYFERKSLKDFIGTLGRDYERFIGELDRTLEYNNFPLIIVVESPLDEALNFDKIAAIRTKIKISPQAIFRNVRTIIQKYPHVQFLFTNSREESVRCMEKIHESRVWHEMDLQLMYDRKLL